MILRPLAAALLAAGLAGPAAAQTPGPASNDFAGRWAARPGGAAGVEIRVRGRRLEARELFTTSNQDRCGTRGTGRANGRTASIRFIGRCADGRTTSATHCTVTLETADRIKSRCRNGHEAVLYRVSQ